VGVISQLRRHAECAVPIADAVKALNKYSHANPRTDEEEVRAVICRVKHHVQSESITLRLNEGFAPLGGCDAVNATFCHSAEELDPTFAPGVMLIADFASYCAVLGINSPGESPYLLHRCSSVAFNAIMRRGLWSPAQLRESHPRTPWATMFCPLTREDVAEAVNVDCLAAIDLVIDVRRLIEDAANFDQPVELYFAPGPAFFVTGTIPSYMITLARLNGRDAFVPVEELTRQDNFRAAEIPDRLPEGGVKGSGKGRKGQKGADNSTHPRAGDNALFTQRSFISYI